MKKFILILATLFLTIISVNGADEANKTLEQDGNKTEGFLTTKWCADRAYFQDCRLESYFCGEGNCFKNWEFGQPEKEELVLFVHDEGKYYNIKLTDKVKRYEIDKVMNRNQVSIFGELNKATNTISAIGIKAPPPAGKSFFKGCL